MESLSSAVEAAPIIAAGHAKAQRTHAGHGPNQTDFQFGHSVVFYGAQRGAPPSFFSEALALTRRTLLNTSNPFFDSSSAFLALSIDLSLMLDIHPLKIAFTGIAIAIIIRVSFQFRKKSIPMKKSRMVTVTVIPESATP